MSNPDLHADFYFGSNPNGEPSRTFRTWPPVEEVKPFECCKCAQPINFPAGTPFEVIRKALEDHRCDASAVFEHGRTGELVAV